MLWVFGGLSFYKMVYFLIYVLCKMLGGMELVVINLFVDGMSGMYLIFIGSDMKKMVELKSKMLMKMYFIFYCMESEIYSLFDSFGNVFYWFFVFYWCEWIFSLNLSLCFFFLSLFLGVLVWSSKDEV